MLQTTCPLCTDEKLLNKIIIGQNVFIDTEKGRVTVMEYEERMQLRAVQITGSCSSEVFVCNDNGKLIQNRMWPVDFSRMTLRDTDGHFCCFKHF